MSSSTESPRVRIVRHPGAATTPALQDLDALSAAALRVIDPEALEEALARGYEDGRGQGYADGLAAARAAVEQEAAERRVAADAELGLVLDALRAACDDVVRRHHEAVEALEGAMVAGALELAEAVLGRELAVAASPGRDALTRALCLADGAGPVIARLHPADVEVLGDASPLAPGRALTIVADPAVDRGGCILQIGDGCVDARLGAALDRARQVLSS